MPQLIRLVQRYKSQDPYVDYDLVDILRDIARHDQHKIINRTWLIYELDMYTYLDDASGELSLYYATWFPGHQLGKSGLVTGGQTLLEKSALSHQVETAFIYRVKNPNEPVHVKNLPAIGSLEYQAVNVDLEIRCYDNSVFEVLTDDDNLISSLAWRFEETQIISELAQ